MIKLHLDTTNDLPVWVRAASILIIQPTATGSDVTIGGDIRIKVKETAETVLQLMQFSAP
jgi:hypothetical protein